MALIEYFVAKPYENERRGDNSDDNRDHAAVMICFRKPEETNSFCYDEGSPDREENGDCLKEWENLGRNQEQSEACE